MRTSTSHYLSQYSTDLNSSQTFYWIWKRGIPDPKRGNHRGERVIAADYLVAVCRVKRFWRVGLNRRRLRPLARRPARSSHLRNATRGMVCPCVSGRRWRAVVPSPAARRCVSGRRPRAVFPWPASTLSLTLSPAATPAATLSPAVAASPAVALDGRHRV